MTKVRTVGDPLTEDQKRRLCDEIYQENSGVSFTTERLMEGLAAAAELLTDDLVREEMRSPAYIAAQ